MMTWRASRWLTLLIVLLTTVAGASNGAAAGSPDDEYVRIYTLFTAADGLSAQGKNEEALKKYREAQAALGQFRRANPSWNPRVVNARLADVAEKIDRLSQPAQSTPESQNQPQSGAAAQPSAGKEEVKLLSAGAEPREPLRFQTSAGDKQQFAIAFKTRISREGGGAEAAQAVPGPSAELTLQTEVLSVAENGDMEIELKVLDAKALGDTNNTPPGMAEAMERGVAEMKTKSSKELISNRGITRWTDANSRGRDRGETNPMQDGLEVMSIQFPEEPVGIGAKWQVRARERRGGPLGTQVITQELVSRNGNRIEVASTVVDDTRTPPRGAAAGGMPGMNIIRMRVNGTGTASVDLGHAMPNAAAGKVRSETTMSVSGGGRTQTVTIQADVEVELRRK